MNGFSELIQVVHHFLKNIIFTSQSL